MREEDEFTQIEKTIPIDPARYGELRRLFAVKKFVTDHINEILFGMLTEAQAREEVAWDMIAKELGFKGIDEVVTSGRMISVDWVGRVFVVRAKPSKEPK